jgi:hypothetical protein
VNFFHVASPALIEVATSLDKKLRFGTSYLGLKVAMLVNVN